VPPPTHARTGTRFTLRMVHAHHCAVHGRAHQPLMTPCRSLCLSARCYSATAAHVRARWSAHDVELVVHSRFAREPCAFTSPRTLPHTAAHPTHAVIRTLTRTDAHACMRVRKTRTQARAQTAGSRGRRGQMRTRSSALACVCHRRRCRPFLTRCDREHLPCFGPT
jgi:hypothetical protein